MITKNEFLALDQSNYLAHHGRKGMKWGKHLFGRVNLQTSLKRFSRTIKSNKRKRMLSKATPEYVYKHSGKFTNAELRKLNERFEQTARAKQLMRLSNTDFDSSYGQVAKPKKDLGQRIDSIANGINTGVKFANSLYNGYNTTSKIVNAVKGREALPSISPEARLKKFEAQKRAWATNPTSLYNHKAAFSSSEIISASKALDELAKIKSK